MKYAKDDKIEIRVDMKRPAAVIQYRILSEGQWRMTPFQRADVRNEDHALRMVNNWLNN